MGTYRYTVSENKLLSPTVRSVKMTCNEGKKPLLFEPGQYAAISLHDRLRPTTTRCFSIASSPNHRSELEFCARVGGKYTRALERLQTGDQIVVRGPFGHFVLKDRKNQNLVFLAGGIGVTPFMSMIRYASELQLHNNLHLVFSCRSQDDIPFFDELVQLENTNPRLRVTYVIGEGTTDRLGNREFITGRLDESSAQTIGFDFARQTFMICGPGGYITAMQDLLTTHGVSHSRILSEAFTQASGGNSLQMSWPLNAYASSGLLLMIFGGLIVTSDLIKTLPPLEATYMPEVTTESEIKSVNGDTLHNIKTLPPQIDTNTTQEPITVRIPNDEVKIVTTSENIQAPTPAPVPTSKPVTVVPVSNPAPTPVASPTPTPAPTQTVKATSKPKTRTS